MAATTVYVGETESYFAFWRSVGGDRSDMLEGGLSLSRSSKRRQKERQIERGISSKQTNKANKEKENKIVVSSILFSLPLS